MNARCIALSHILPLLFLVGCLSVTASWAQCPKQALEGGSVVEITGAQVSIGLLLIPRFMIVEGYGHFQNENSRIALKHKIDAAVDMIRNGQFTAAKNKIEEDIIDKLQKWLDAGGSKDTLLWFAQNSRNFLGSPHSATDVFNQTTLISALNLSGGNPVNAAQLIMGMGILRATNHPNLQCCGEHWDWKHIEDILSWF